ncbi:MAG TPA: DoxX family protein [Pirellulales bacterium]|nr:DoxX family protein [Pirellulales bacterium]
MIPQNKWLKVAGVVLNVLIAALMIMAGSGKVFGFAPQEVVEGMAKYGLGNRLQLIGLGEMTAAILLIIPWTSPLGTLLTSGFWGGVICIHMSHQENFINPSVLLAVTWAGAFLRGSVPLLAVKPADSSTRTSA